MRGTWAQMATKAVEDGVVIPFMEKTWFLWWILASIFLLRWFHLISPTTGDRGFEARDSSEEQAPVPSGPISSGSASHLFS